MEKIALFFDKFGWIFIVILFMALGISAAAFATKNAELSERIEKLEGCCSEVQQYMQDAGKADETKLMEYVDQRLSEESAKQTEAVTKLLESSAASMKEEIETSVSEQIIEQVKNETQQKSRSSQKTGTRKKTNNAGSSQTSVQSQTTTTITTQRAAESTYQEKEYDPDDKHFKVGSGDEEED
ncbi:MAG: hypothetical protein K6E75_01260 [Lachnospiraceae bacterium]|nr:hypothetical protein [Lachnospiraceae bacterium]